MTYVNRLRARSSTHVRSINKHRLAGAIVAVAVLWTVSTYAQFRKVPYIGYDWATHCVQGNSLPDMPGRANMVVLRPDCDPVNDVNFTAPIRNDPNIRVILWLGGEGESTVEEKIANPHVMRDYLARVKAKTDAGQITGRVSGIQLQEEWYFRLRGGAFDHWNYFTSRGWYATPEPGQPPPPDSMIIAMIQAMQAGLNQVASVINEETYFPNVVSINSDIFYYEGLEYGVTNYNPVPPAAETIMMYPYLSGLSSSACDQAFFDKFYQEVERFYDYAVATYTPAKSIIAVGQAFADNGGPFGFMPAPCQLERWYTVVAQKSNSIIGLQWFLWRSIAGPPGPGNKGVSHPDHTAQKNHLDAIYNFNKGL